MQKYLLPIIVLISLIPYGKRVVKKWQTSYPKSQVAEHRIPEKDQPIVVLTLSYNNEKYVVRNLQSVLAQDYQNFRVIYIDDASKDGTFAKVKETVGDDPRFTLIHHEKNRGAMANFVKAVQMCRDDEICVVLDGDDWFAHDRVLSRLNGYYAPEDVWMTYGQHVEYPGYGKGFCVPYDTSKSVREQKFIFSHLRTFYAGLFKRIDVADFKKEGDYFSMGADVAMMLPMAELAGPHLYFIPEVLCVYNCDNPISDCKTNLSLQEGTEAYIKGLKSYEPLEELHYR